ncbi:MAG: hypothetical protein M1818_002623 [Claussenomyces sp. TS43310]|nr:MAG: hypothetical protein M1818_002623 [Claussenomyces sp. TS43310]
MLQCLPISYFWDKTQPGRCLPNALITIGLTNGVLSFVGDLAILLLPLPMIWKLHINRKNKIAVSGMFMLGGLVCVISILRFIALANIDTKDITFTQVDPGVWTYTELGVGIICGNLPLLRPLFGSFFRSKDGSSYATNQKSGALHSFSRNTRPTVRSDAMYGSSGNYDRDSEERIIGSNAVEMEIVSMGKGADEMRYHHDPSPSGIKVQTDFEFHVEEVGDHSRTGSSTDGRAIQTEVRAASRGGLHGNVF